MTPAQAVPGRVAQLIRPMREDPRGSAVLCDVDGTLAPIVADPGDAIVPVDTQETLRALARRFALVGCVSGRRAAEARWLVGVEELTYVGNHGLELLRPGAEQPELEPSVAPMARAARDFVLDLDAATLSDARLTIENKGPIQALHWRTADDGQVAEARARQIAAEAEDAGLAPHWGRKVLELRPTDEVDKGTAVRRLLAGGNVERALFAGDDRTDLDAFAALRELATDGELSDAVCIGISSEEGPAELTSTADALVSGPDEFRSVLRSLLESSANAPDS